MAPINGGTVFYELTKLNNLVMDEEKRLRFLSSLRSLRPNEAKYLDVLNIGAGELNDIRKRLGHWPDSRELTELMELIRRIEELEEKLKAHCV